MNYQHYIEQFVELLSKRTLDLAPIMAGNRHCSSYVGKDTVTRCLLSAAEAAFHDIPSEALINILTTKLRNDLRRAGFAAALLHDEECNELNAHLAGSAALVRCVCPA